jgi:hypothetical protein
MVVCTVHLEKSITIALFLQSISLVSDLQVFRIFVLRRLRRTCCLP